MDFNVEFVSSEVKPLKISLTMAMLSSAEDNDEMEVGWASDSPIFDLSNRAYGLNELTMDFFINELGIFQTA